MAPDASGLHCPNCGAAAEPEAPRLKLERKGAADARNGMSARTVNARWDGMGIADLINLITRNST